MSGELDSSPETETDPAPTAHDLARLAASRLADGMGIPFEVRGPGGVERIEPTPRGPAADSATGDVETAVCDFCDQHADVAVSEQAVTTGARICAECAQWALDTLRAGAPPELASAEGGT